MRTSRSSCIVMVTWAVALAGCSSGEGPKEAGPRTEEARPAPQVAAAAAEGDVLAMIRRLGGKYLEDPNELEGPVIEVNLRKAKLTDTDLERLQALPMLRVLDVRETLVTDDGVKRFEAARPNCRVAWK